MAVKFSTNNINEVNNTIEEAKHLDLIKALAN